MMTGGSGQIMACLVRVLTPSSPAEQTSAMREFHSAIEQLQRERDEAVSALRNLRPHAATAQPSQERLSKLNLDGWPWR